MLLARLPPDSRTVIVGCDADSRGGADPVAGSLDSIGGTAHGSGHIDPVPVVRVAMGRVADIRWSPDGRLPLADGSVECVVLLGAPERPAPLPSGDARSAPRVSAAWTALASTVGTRAWRGRQREVLREVRRVLVPEGQIVVLIRNRFDHAWFRGRPDPCTGLRFASLLPRRIADLYSVFATGTPCSAWMHSSREYRRCLRDAGFQRLETCGLTPTLERPKALVPFGTRGQAWRLRPLRGLNRVRRHRCFVPAYGLIASVRALPRESAAEEIVRRIEAAVGAEPRSCRLSNFRITAKNKGIIQCAAGSRRAILKVAFDAAAERGNLHNYAVLQRIAEIPELRGLVPAPVITGVAGGLRYHVETEVRGALLSTVLNADNTFDYLPRISEALRAINPRLSERSLEPFTGGIYRRQVLDPLARIEQATGRRSLVDRVRALLQSQLDGVAVRPGLVHGDFCDDNIAVEGGAITGIIDWEDAYDDGIVALDALNHIEACHRRARRKSSTVEVLASLDRWDGLPAAEQSFLAEHYRRCGLGPAHHLALTCLYWVRHVADQLDGALAEDATAMEQRIVRPLEHFVERGRS